MYGGYNQNRRGWISTSGRKPPVYLEIFFNRHGNANQLPFIIETDEPGSIQQLQQLIDKECRNLPPLVKKILIVNNRKKLKTEVYLQLLKAGFHDIIDFCDEKETTTYLEALVKRNKELQEVLDSDLVTKNLVGESAVWKKFLSDVIEASIHSEGSLLLTGQSGTGKELLSRLIHTMNNRPGKKELILLDCTTIVPELSGSEFFGHERGSYTSAVQSREGAFSLANNGTLFLDEIGELPLALQAELLRVIQEGTYKKVGSNNWQKTSFRLITATHRNIRDFVNENRFRQDLFFRISDFEFRVPSLRERPDDILPLTMHFLQEHFNEEVPELDDNVKELLLSRDYPGNVRELKQLVQRISMKHGKQKKITIGEIPRSDLLLNGVAEKDQGEDALIQAYFRKAIILGATLWDLKDMTMQSATEASLKLSNGNKKLAAEKLGVTVRAIQQFLKKVQ